MLGQEINNRYRILKTLGTGGMASVYLARDMVLGRDVAAKLLHNQLADDTDLCRRFLEEARMAALLDHPNIIKIFDFGQTHQRISFIIYEYISGYNFHTLQKQHVLQYGSPFEPIVPMMVVFEVLKALEMSHKSQFIHRDVKPDNIMISKIGSVKLMDFGIAKNLSLSRTQRGEFLGSPSYASPEQVQGFDVDMRTDLYSVGVVLYEALSGQLPFRGKSSTELMMNIANGSHAPLSVVCPFLDKKLTNLVEKSLSKEKSHRFANAQSMREALLPLIQSHGVFDPSQGLNEYYTNKLVFLSSIKTQKGKAVIPAPLLTKRTVIRKRKTNRKRVTLKVLNSNRKKTTTKTYKYKNKLISSYKYKRKKSSSFPFFFIACLSTLILATVTYKKFPNIGQTFKNRIQNIVRRFNPSAISTVSFRGGPSGTRVYVDGVPTGTLKGIDHLFEMHLTPGAKLLQAIYKPVTGETYTTYQSGVNLKPGAHLFLGNIQLYPLSLVRISSNTHAHVTINGAVSYQVRASKPIELHLQAGHYKLEARALAGLHKKISKVVEAKGQNVKVELFFP